MQLDTTTKVVTLVSVIVGVMISLAGYFTGLKLQALDERLKSLDERDKNMDLASKDYNLSPRLVTEFYLPLARSFAEEYTHRTDTPSQPTTILLPITALVNEFSLTIPKWKSRRGLMTGQACQAQGLKTRQVITLMIKNIGHADATQVTIKALLKPSPHPQPTTGWQQLGANHAPLPYYDLSESTSGWKLISFKVPDLRGQSSPEKSRNQAQVVLASVSGATTWFGTVLVPIEISWTNKITHRPEVQRIMETEIPKLRFSLLGAEIGTACSE